MKEKTMKKDKTRLILTTLLILLPIAAGMILWNRLPEQIAVHFNANNEPNGWASRAFAVFGIPVVLAVLHFAALAATNADPRKKNISENLHGLSFWIIPIISLVLNSTVYCYAVGVAIDIGFIACCLLGILFILIGNFMPKAGQNHSIGIRWKYTLRDPENWRKTNRLGGFLLVFDGILLLFLSFWKPIPLLLALLFLSVLIPYLYSFLLAKKKK